MASREASTLQMPVWSAVDLGIDAGRVGRGAAAVQWTRIHAPPPRESNVELISADPPEAIAAALADKLLAEKVI